jgi:hypothetical protein
LPAAFTATCLRKDSFTEQPLANALPADKDALLRHIEKTSPESLALARDWEGIASSIAKSQAKLERYVVQICLF